MSSSPNTSDYSSCEDSNHQSMIIQDHDHIDQLVDKVEKQLIFQDPPSTIPSTYFYTVSPKETRLSIRTDSQQVPKFMSMFFAIEQYMELRDSILFYSKELFTIEKFKSNSNQLLLHSLLWEREKSTLETFKFTKQEQVHEFMQVGTQVYY